MLNIENVEKLRDALASGKYKKGVSVLRDSYDCYCVLGVGCEIAIENGVQIRVEIEKLSDNDDPSYSYDNRTVAPPPKVIEFYGFSAKDITQLMTLSDTSPNFFGCLYYLEKIIREINKGISC